MLSHDEYDDLLRQNLARLRLTPVEIEETLGQRWPMNSSDVLAEMLGRGRDLQPDDFHDFLAEYFAGTDFHAEEVDGFRFNARQVDAFAVWAIQHNRGTPAQAVPVFDIPDMLDLLRSEFPGVRVLGGTLLAESVGKGLALMGETREDAEHLIGPQISDVIGRAIAGDDTAVTQLESMLTSQLSEALRPQSEREPA